MNLEERDKDPFIKSLFDEAGMEQPSGLFTQQIINRLQSQRATSASVYEPVIGRRAWIVIALCGVSLFLYLFFATSPEGQGLDYFGYATKLYNTFIGRLLDKVAFSFTLSPILKTSFLALIFFTFTNLIIFEFKSRTFFK